MSDAFSQGEGAIGSGISAQMLRADLVVGLATSCSRHLADCNVVVVPFIVVVVFAFNRWENHSCELFLSVRASKLGALSTIFNLHTNI